MELLGPPAIALLFFVPASNRIPALRKVLPSSLMCVLDGSTSFSVRVWRLRKWVVAWYCEPARFRIRWWIEGLRGTGLTSAGCAIQIFLEIRVYLLLPSIPHLTRDEPYHSVHTVLIPSMHAPRADVPPAWLHPEAAAETRGAGRSWW